MSAPSPASSASGQELRGGTGRGRRAPKGTICTACMRRKIRCDGKRPFCSQCEKSKIDDDCQYNDGIHKSKTLQLTEEVRTLEQQIKALEDRNASSPVPNAMPPPQHIEAVPAQPGPSYEFFQQSLRWSEDVTAARATMNATPGQPSTQAPLAHDQNLVDSLIVLFLPYRQQVGLDLSHDLFIQVLYNHTGDRNCIHPALASAICLWACVLHPTTVDQLLEGNFLTATMDNLLCNDQSQLNEQELVNNARAACLLATYFFTRNRLADGAVCANSAANTARYLGLNRITLHPNSPPSSIYLGDLGTSFGNARLADRVQAWWQIYYVITTWSVVMKRPLGTPNTPQPEHLSRINTPWPQAEPTVLQEYLHDSLFTVRNLISPNELTIDDGDVASIKYRAVALFHRAIFVGGAFNPASCTPEELQQFNMVCSTVTRNLYAARQYAQNIVFSIQFGEADSTHPFFVLALSRALLSVGWINLCVKNFEMLTRLPVQSAVNHEAKRLSIQDIVDVIANLQDHHYQFLDPMFGFCWLCVIIAGVSRRNKIVAQGEFYGGDPDELGWINHYIETALNAMQKLGSTYPFVASFHARADAMIHNRP